MEIRSGVDLCSEADTQPCGSGLRVPGQIDVTGPQRPPVARGPNRVYAANRFLVSLCLPESSSLVSAAITPRGPVPLHRENLPLLYSTTRKPAQRLRSGPSRPRAEPAMDTIMQQQKLPSPVASSSAAADAIVSATLSQYSALPFAPQPGKHTVLASFALHDPDAGRVRLLSLGAGVKCLPAHRLPVRGDALHDSHAEVLARRGAIRWLLEEVQRDVARAQEEETKSADAAWVCARADGLYALRDNVHLWMYASTVPCTSHPFSFPTANLLPPQTFSTFDHRTCHLIFTLFCVSPRWRCVHGNPRSHTGPRSVRTHGRRHAPSPATGDTLSGPRRLRTTRCVTDQTGSRGCATRAQHVVQRQDRALVRAWHTRRARQSDSRTHIHPRGRAWRGRSFYAGASPNGLRPCIL